MLKITIQSFQEELLGFLGMETHIKVSDLCEDEAKERVYSTVTASDIRDGLVVIDDDAKLDEARGSDKIVEQQKDDSNKATKSNCDDVEVVNHNNDIANGNDETKSETKQSKERRKSTKVLIGTVKKWKQLDDINGHGFIRMDDGREWSFHSRDCPESKRYEGFVLFQRGDKVSFLEQEYKGNRRHHNATPRAVNVFYYDEEVESKKLNQLTLNRTVKETVPLDSKLDKPVNEIVECDTNVTVETETPVPDNHNKSEEVKTPKVQPKKKSRPEKLVTLFREFDQMKKEEVFSTSLHSCHICYTDKVRLL